MAEQLFFDRVDTVPYLPEDELNYDFLSWITVLIDTLNEFINDTEADFNLLAARDYTAAQIAALFTAGTLVNGNILYDTTNNEYVGMQSGALVKFTTTPYP
jgi:hypothetical protein